MKLKIAQVTYLKSPSGGVVETAIKNLRYEGTAQEVQVLGVDGWMPVGWTHAGWDKAAEASPCPRAEGLPTVSQEQARYPSWRDRNLKRKEARQHVRALS